jgi:stage V sporulation protein G
MEITDIRIRMVDTEGKLKAYVTLTFDECFVVHNLKIISGQAGTFVAMPSRKTKNGEYKDIAHPINSDFRNTLQSKILEEYNRLGGQEEREEETAEEKDDTTEMTETTSQEASETPAEEEKDDTTEMTETTSQETSETPAEEEKKESE